MGKPEELDPRCRKSGPENYLTGWGWKQIALC